MLNGWGRDTVQADDVITASSIAGGIAGCTGGLLRMAIRPNISPNFLTTTRGP